MTFPVVIAGAGSLGQSFAGLLAQNGQPVTLLATTSRMAAARDRCDPIMRRGGCRGAAGAIHARERSGGSATRREGDLDYQTTDLEGLVDSMGAARRFITACVSAVA
jgi:hypothetical protein